MVTFVCVKWGTLYGPEYVNTLYDMVTRNLAEGTAEGEFICFTDDPSGLLPSIKTRSLPAGLTGWWNKLALFAPDVFEKGERIIYLDLDTVIVGPIDDILKYQGEFAILQDFYRPDGWQSSFMSWQAGFGHWIWERFNELGRPDIEGGDQVFIEQMVPHAHIWQVLFPDWFVSYKRHCVDMFPKGARVVIFHGEPRPHQAGGWVEHVWKIGGGTAAELELLCNTRDEKLIHNINSCIKRDLPWVQPLAPHNRHAVIVGGGPSVANLLPEIEWRQDQGQDVFALNGVISYLFNNNIYPDNHVMIDARGENLRFIQERLSINYFLASQVDPIIYSALHDKNVQVFHLATDGMQELIQNDKRAQGAVMIGGGRTVGMAAIGLAYALGYRNIHLYGFDSSYSDNEHHAYKQDINDTDLRVECECGGQKFSAAPWMIDQVEAFQNMANILVQEGVIFTVHGEGLLPQCARMMSKELLPADEIIKVEGVYWPSADKETRNYINGTLEDIDHILKFVKNRRIAVQAGGNVGIWPAEFAKHFDAVYTFEPDALNFRCLSLNCPQKNIIKMQALLGYTRGSHDLNRDDKNCGAHSVGGKGIYPVIRIDDLHLPYCDLIQLDIEGYELQALKGAHNTIRDLRPVIVVEDKGLSEQYGSEQGAIAKWLATYGYQLSARVHRDLIFTVQQ